MDQRCLESSRTVADPNMVQAMRDEKKAVRGRYTSMAGARSGWRAEIRACRMSELTP